MVQKFYPYYFIFFLFPVVGFKGGRALGVAKGHPTPLHPPTPAGRFARRAKGVVLRKKEKVETGQALGAQKGPARKKQTQGLPFRSPWA